MLIFKRAAILVSLLFAFLIILNAQTGSSKEATGVISGRITVGNKPASGIVVVAALEFDRDRKATAQALTDAEGRYRLRAIPAGRYNVRPLAPVYNYTDVTPNGEAGKTVNIKAGETVEGTDFALARGGVITGRVTNADGRPAIEEHVDLMRVDEGSQPWLFSSYRNYFMFQTDDRGVYRLYGLPAGRYKLSVGANPNIRPPINNPRGYYVRTFHPDVADESKAEVVELAEGGEATGIDIRLGSRGETYIVTGRVVDAESGKPLPHVSVSIGNQPKGREGFTWFGGPLNLTNEKGEFRIEGFAPGMYSVFVMSAEINELHNDTYSDPLMFEVTGTDVTGLEIKAHRGASLEGQVVLENSGDKAVFARLAQLQVYASVTSSTNLYLPISNSSPIGPDGSFHINGLRPGKVQLFLNGPSYDDSKPFSQLRLEREGVEQRNGIDVSGGEKVTNIRLVVAYGTGIVRGEIKIEGGVFPPGSRFYLRANRVGDESHMMGRPSEVDSRGHFTIEGLTSGTYELTLEGFMMGQPGQPRPNRLLPVKQIVNVTEGAESEVTFTVELKAKKEEPQ